MKEALPPPKRVRVGPQSLEGDLRMPLPAHGLVVFAHGSGSSRRSPRNVQVAEAFQTHGLGSLLFDLLLPAEAADRAHVFDIDLLAQRLIGAIEWVEHRPSLVKLPLALFGASTGAAAALVAASRCKARVRSVVSRGGRPDLAMPALAQVDAPTLLIVGGADTEVLALNRQALACLNPRSRLVIVPGATHLFEEPGALEEVTELAVRWLFSHFDAADAALQATRPTFVNTR